MIEATERGRAYLRRASLDIRRNSLSETILAAIADRGPIEEEELQDIFEEVGSVEKSLEALAARGYARSE